IEAEVGREVRAQLARLPQMNHALPTPLDRVDDQPVTRLELLDAVASTALAAAQADRGAIGCVVRLEENDGGDLGAGDSSQQRVDHFGLEGLVTRPVADHAR